MAIQTSEIRRVVCLQPSATAIIASLGLLERVVACTRYCVDLCPEAAGRTIVADSWSAQAEQIRAAGADLVIASVPYQAESVSEILKAGARFLGLSPRSLADVCADIAAIAGILGVPEHGRGVVGNFQAEIAAVRERATAAAFHPRVFCEEWGKPILRSQPWVAELVEATGGQFLGEPGARALPRSVEAEDPDVIIAAWCGAGERVPLEKIVSQRGWDSMRAVCQQRVYCIRDDYLNTPAPTLVYGLHALASAIHPELFPAAPGLRRIKAGATR
ncbi:MAG: ABC transporter substrate-binding protein [Terriglobales bacterium]